MYYLLIMHIAPTLHFLMFSQPPLDSQKQPEVQPPTPAQSAADKAAAAAAKEVEDIEKELELDLDNLKIDENVDTSVSVLW